MYIFHFFLQLSPCFVTLFQPTCLGGGAGSVFSRSKASCRFNARLAPVLHCVHKKPLSATPRLSEGVGSFVFLYFCLFCTFVFQYAIFRSTISGFPMLLCFCISPSQFYSAQNNLILATPRLSKRG